jgi:hypothetical protein
VKALCLLLLAVTALAQEALTPRERILLERIERLEQRLAALEAKSATSGTATGHVSASQSAQASEPPRQVEAIPPGTTINLYLDGYYGYNFNSPVTGTNALRAYDVSANSFAINQAGMVIERQPDPSTGRRIGGRLDLMFGQATETLQGSPANERRPEVFRNIFQAYGTLVAPLGSGITVDFGKWASAFGIENNYTKDQFNYSRSFWFNFLPFYHVGFRASYPLTGRLNVSYWLTNGLNQSEDFNGFKSHAVLLNFTPSPRLSASLNYFHGQEQRAVKGRAPRGRSHFLDGYVTWQAAIRWTVAGEWDYAVERIGPDAAPKVVFGGAGYARYRLVRKVHLAGRFAYLNDRNGWFSGRNQALKEATATATFDLADGFQMRWEARRDWSNSPWFATEDPTRHKRHQTTALLGLIWWFGGKKGPW